MKKLFCVLLMLSAYSSQAATDFSAPIEANASQKGSLLYFPNVEVQYFNNINDPPNFPQVPLQDTLIELTNDSDQGVFIQLYFVNGDDPITEEERSGVFPFELLERTHPGWNFVDAQIYLSPNQSTYWSSLGASSPSGNTSQLPSFGNLDADPGIGPDFIGDGRPDPDATTDPIRTVRGYIVGWAVSIDGNETTHNNLTGKATICNYGFGSSATYSAFAYKRLSNVSGDGTLDLDGVEYDQSPARLQFDFFTTVPGAFATIAAPDSYSNGIVDTDISLMPASLDFSNNGEPVSTFVQADIWNQNETRFSGTGRCISCWDQTYLQNFQGSGVIAGNHFIRSNIGTDKGKARLTGKTNQGCLNSIDVPILGVAGTRFITTTDNIFPSRRSANAWNLSLQGTDDSASIVWEVIDSGQELQEVRDTEMQKIRTNRQRLLNRNTNNRRHSNSRK